MSKVSFYTQAPAGGAVSMAGVIRRDTNDRAGPTVKALGGLWSEEPATAEELAQVPGATNYRVTVEELDD